jgi:zinc protease
MADLQSIQREDLYQHYRTFYLPNNALLAMAGDFSAEAMLERIRCEYGPIPAGPMPARLKRPEPAQHGERRVVVEGPGETVFTELAYHVPPAADADFLPASVLTAC